MINDITVWPKVLAPDTCVGERQFILASTAIVISLMTDWILGTMLYINLDSKKTDTWWKYVRTQRNIEEAFQTYVIHSTTCSHHESSEYWWEHQSNVHGVVVAVNDIPKDSIGSYPRSLGKVVEQFIPGLLIAEGDFGSSSERRNILGFSGKGREILFKALHIGLYSLLQNFHLMRQRQEARYAGRSCERISEALTQCNNDNTTAEDDEDAEAQLSGFSMISSTSRKRTQSQIR